MRQQPWQKVQGDINLITGWLIKNNLTIEENFQYKDIGTKRIIAPKLTSNQNYFNVSKKTPKYVSEFCKIIENSNFSFKLFDHSIIQCLYTFDGPDLIKQKFCYFEFPTGFDDIFSNDAPNTNSSLSEINQNHWGIPTHLRIDFDPERYDSVLHPKTHLSLGGNRDCRIPTSSPIKLIDFIEFVVKNFYHQHWNSLCEFLTINRSNFKELPYSITIDKDEQSLIFLHTHQ